MIRQLPSGPLGPRTRRGRFAGATTSVPGVPAMSMPEWNCLRFVNGETRAEARGQPALRGPDRRRRLEPLALALERSRAAPRGCPPAPARSRRGSRRTARAGSRAPARPRSRESPGAASAGAAGPRSGPARRPALSPGSTSGSIGVTSSPPEAAEPGRFAMIRTFRSSSEIFASRPSTSPSFFSNAATCARRSAVSLRSEASSWLSTRSRT